MIFNLLEKAASPEKWISQGEAIELSAFGFGMVFFVLAVLAVLIYIMGKAIAASNKKSKPEAEVSSAAASEKAREPLKLVNVDEKTAAIIMAIVAEKSGLPLEKLDFKSIQLIEE